MTAGRNYSGLVRVGSYITADLCISFQYVKDEQMLRSRDEWKDDAEAHLPPQENITGRNRAITSHYARLYLEHPDFFKWAGMAAFASSQVGIALGFIEVLGAPGKMMEQRESAHAGGFLEGAGDAAGGVVKMLLSLPVSLYDAATRAILLNDLEEIRKGNNAIYNDIAWAHNAYIEGGLDELDGNTIDREKELLLPGFSMIDEGKKRLEKDGEDDQARHMIREGNIKLLRHEQIKTLAPVFEAISMQGRILVSFGSELNFGEAAPPGCASRASFADHFGYLETLTGIRSVTNPEHRWQWIEENVLPAWNAVDTGFPVWEGAARQFSRMYDG